MRHIPDGIEPQELKEFRVARPNATWDDFRNEAQDAYKRLLEQVVSHQCGLCAYCEIDLSETDRMIEHFHPKSDMSSGHNWGLDFENMLATCKGGSYRYSKDENRFMEPLQENLSCDQSKGDRNLDDIILHPRDIPIISPVLQVGMTGEIRPDAKHCEESGVPAQKLLAAIGKQNLNLNCNRLKDARRKVWERLSQYERNGETAENLMRDFLLPDSNGRLFRFFTTIKSYFAEDSGGFFPRVDGNY